MTEIYLIRHAQAEGNRYRVMQGFWDSDVTALGRVQIEELALRFRDDPVDAVYASDLFRARLTATAAARWGNLPLHTDADLREINVGPWEGLFFGDVCYDEPESAQDFMYDAENWRHEGAETYGQVRERAYAALERIARAHEGQRVAVFSHAVTIRCLLSKVTGYPLDDTENLPISRNTSVALLRWENGVFTPVYFNDISHLSPLSLPAWSSTGDLRQVPLDPARDRAYYEQCYADAWMAAHGSLDGFSPQSYWDAALQHLRDDPGAVLRMYYGDEPVGLVDLDTRRGAHAGYGWVSLLYLKPEYRNQGYGIQLLGRVYLKYQTLGRRSVRLHAAEENAAALAFYRREGFRELSRESGNLGPLLLLEHKWRRREDV